MVCPDVGLREVPQRMVRMQGSTRSWPDQTESGRPVASGPKVRRCPASTIFRSDVLRKAGCVPLPHKDELSEWSEYDGVISRRPVGYRRDADGATETSVDVVPVAVLSGDGTPSGSSVAANRGRPPAGQMRRHPRAPMLSAHGRKLAVIFGTSRTWVRDGLDWAGCAARRV